MNPKFFSSAILLGGLYLMVALISTVGILGLGQRLGELPSFGVWYFLQWLISLVWLLMLLNYLHLRGYRVAFWSLVILITAAIVNFILAVKVFSTYEITNNYVVSAYLLPITYSVLGVSLALSEAKQRFWLKMAGITMGLYGLLKFISTVWIANSLTAMHDGTGNQIAHWISLIEFPILILFLLNFHFERKESKQPEMNHGGQVSNAINFIVFVAFLPLSFFGYQLNTEIKNLSGTSNFSEYDQILADPFESGIYKNDHGDSLPYRLLIPKNYDLTKSYPLVVALHGSSGRGNDNVKQISRSLFAQLLSKPQHQIKYPAFVLVPQCPSYEDWGGITNIKSVDHLVIDLISELETKFTIDKNRRYITGISMGGFGVWHLISSQPEMFAAAVPICGAGDPEFADKLTDIPIWAFHGKKDRNVLVEGSRRMIEAIRSEGGDPKYTEYPDKAHHIFSDVKHTPELLDWLFSQKRE